LEALYFSGFAVASREEDTMATPTYNGTVVAALSVKKFRESLAWYRDVLGFETVYSFEDPMKWGEVSTPVPGLTIGIGETADDVPQTGWMMLTFGVDDIDAARATLEASGVQFDGPTEDVHGMVRLATFRDPDGNRFMLAQTLANPAG
jgi:CreA protein